MAEVVDHSSLRLAAIKDIRRTASEAKKARSGLPRATKERDLVRNVINALRHGTPTSSIRGQIKMGEAETTPDTPES